ncbi:hypothetical protein DFP94_10980 [Fontibacillus phaseoli]|uniref:Uncharacterized protein n=1 Tax=Fontibacillus phaseoli TaxID=1416533 RepID=A0A369B9W6_9BACL|nr:hypothetical protein [Fontibacillus phaseoli]RCX17356.1 hypothetical protein DFP94_10980 [Fontibacillus phaseoli]
MSNMHELKMAVTLEHHVVLTLEDGNSIVGLPKWGHRPEKVQIRTVEGAVWVMLEEIKHVTRIIPMQF